MWINRIPFRLASKYGNYHLCSIIMNRFNTKYKNPTVLFILFEYFFLFGFNILHYHEYKVILDFPKSIVNTNEQSRDFNHFVNIDFQCPVHNTYTSLHNVVINISGEESTTLHALELFNLKSQDFYFQKELFLSNALRAPPALFS